MRDGVFLDTSFLITLADPTRDRHPTAKAYYQHFLKKRMPMALSAIVIAEFCVRQELSTLPLKQFILISFTHEDAQIVAGFDFKKFRQPDTDRQSLKDDLKIIGHAKSRDYGYLITDDGATMGHYCRKLQNEGLCQISPITLQDGFSLKAFASDHQGDFSQILKEEAANYGSNEDR